MDKHTITVLSEVLWGGHTYEPGKNLVSQNGVEHPSIRVIRHDPEKKGSTLGYSGTDPHAEGGPKPEYLLVHHHMNGDESHVTLSHDEMKILHEHLGEILSRHSILNQYPTG